MGRDIVPVRGPDVDSARAALQAPGPVTWRRLQLRFGRFEMSYASIRRKAEKHPATTPVAALPAPRQKFRHRFVGLTGVLLASSLFLIGAASLWSITSSAVVMRTVYNWPITVAGTKVQDERARAVSAQPDRQTDRLRAPIAAVAIVEAAPAAAARGDGSAAVTLDPVTPTVDLAHLDRIPAVRNAIARAYASGEMQNWQAGALEGVVVIGPETQKSSDMVCRSGTILARDGSFAGRTQPFERCSRS